MDGTYESSCEELDENRLKSIQKARGQLKYTIVDAFVEKGKEIACVT